jgi:hypothetical protein
LYRCIEGTTLVFMFSTRFGAEEGEEQAEGNGNGNGTGTLKVSSHVRRHVSVGTLVVTVNNVLNEADGFELLRKETGPDSERTGGSTAYVWAAV